MRETEFIDLNKGKWQRLEEVRSAKSKDAEELSDLYVEVTNDLSYAKSYYPNRSIRVYLNNISMMIHSSVYRVRDSAFKRFSELWTQHIPVAYYQARYSLLISFLVFFGALAVGVLSSSEDATFTTSMLSEEYIEMTMDNIANGRPMDVYAQETEMNMFTRITINNIQVALNAFVMGLLFMAGSILVLIQNGAMLGSFHHMFYAHDLLGESLLTVWMHGTPEITAIILSGAAGLELGRGMVFPGTYKRKEAFVLGARRGMLMMLAVIPLLVYAGVVESFLTRHTDLGDTLRAFFILLNVAALFFYFYMFPRIMARSLGRKDVAEQAVPEAIKHDYQLSEIKGNGHIFSDAMSLFASDFTRLLLPSLGLAIGSVLLVFLVVPNAFSAHFDTSLMMTYEWDVIFTLTFARMQACLDLNGFPWLVVTFVICISGAGVLALRTIQNQFSAQARYVKSIPLIAIVGLTLLVTSIFAGVLLLGGFISFILGLLLLPLLTMAIVFFITPATSGNIGSLFLRVISRGYLGFFIPTLLVFLCAFLFVMLMDSALVDYVLQSLLNSFQMQDSTFFTTLTVVGIILTYWMVTLLFPAFVFVAFFAFWSSNEKETAAHLKEKITVLGHRKKAYGIIRE